MYRWMTDGGIGGEKDGRICGWLDGGRAKRIDCGIG